MILVQSIIQELQELPTPALLKAAQYIHRLNPKKKFKQDRFAVLKALAGSISREDADRMNQAIKESDQVSMHNDDCIW